ncbi:MAG: glycosyl hydrolase family 28 protein [Sphaerochaeta sp.]|jgi:polygalacturonase|nr:glycosyl hydrolase family 28 protein [Sphaerochaeta sp.]
MRTYDVKRDFQAFGDGAHDDSAALSAALSALSSGDTLSIPAGVYLTGPLTVDTDRITIVLEAHSSLRFLDDPTRYEPVKTRWEGVRCWAMHPCLWITESKDVVIKGEGTLDGNGAWWWTQAGEKKHQQGPVTDLERKFAALNPGFLTQPGGGGGRSSQFLRPPLLQIHHSQNVTIQGITLRNSPFWTLHPVFSQKITIRDLTIENPNDAPNTDGIDIDSCQQVTVTGCTVTVGDDGIAVKSGIGEDALAVGIPTTDVDVRDCVVRFAHGGAVIGSETGGGIHHISFANCRFDGTDRGVRVKTRRGRAGDISDLSFTDITVHGALCPLTINMYYMCGATDHSLFSLDAQPVGVTTPHIHDVAVKRLRSDGIRCMAAFIVGLPERPVERLVLEECSFALADDGLEPVAQSEMYQGLPDNPSRGIRLRNVSVRLSAVSGCPVEKETGVTELKTT